MNILQTGNLLGITMYHGAGDTSLVSGSSLGRIDFRVRVGLGMSWFRLRLW